MYARFIKVNWNQIASALSLSETDTANLFSDGRLSGELLQRVAIRQFGLIETKNGSNCDAKFPLSQEKMEIRLITKNGLSTAPSNQIGVKRDFDKEAYCKKLETVDFFILIDLRSVADNIPCYLVPSSIIRRSFIKGILDKRGSTRSNRKIALVLLESIKFAWERGLGKI